MATAFSIRKPAYHKCKYSKHRVIQSPATLPSYTLPPSPPHKHLQHQHHSIGNGVVSSSVGSTLSTNSRDVVVANQWIVLSKIGEGSFGEVFEAEDLLTHRHYAIKRESLDAPFPQLKHESIMYDVLMGGPLAGIPQCQWYGEHDDFACIVIDLLGPCLKQVQEAVPCMPLEVVMEIGCQMVSILEHIHSRGIVYRDVKPDNFLLPATCHLPDNNTMMMKNPSSTSFCQNLFQGNHMPMLSVVDFGLATWWRNPQTNRPYPQSKRRIKNKTGTARYASLSVHKGKTHGRRDDMESLGYLLLDLILGSLPWAGIQARNCKAGWDRMREIKEDLPLTDLCEGLPVGLMEFIEYTRRLQFSDQPNYDYLRHLLRESCQTSSQYAKIVVPRDEPKNNKYEPSPPTSKTSNNNSKTSEEGVFVMDDLAAEFSVMVVTNGNGGNGENAKRSPGRRRRNSNKKQQQQALQNQQQQSKRAPPSPPSPSAFSMKKQGASIPKSVGWNTHRHRLPVVHPHPTHHHEDWVNKNPKAPSWGEE